MLKSTTMAFRLRDETKDALKKAAEVEERTMSFITDRALAEWLSQNGYLPTPKPKKPRA